MEQSFSDRYWTSTDGLRLHFRDYSAAEGASADALPVLCLHGLTRNARDFAPLAEHMAAQRRVLVPEMRGRADSEYASDSSTYTPVHYVGDVLALLEQEGITRFISVGTSLGGLMTMMLATVASDRLAAAVINDIGPEVDPEGIEKIREYVGHGRSFPTWMHAAEALRETLSASYPRFTLDDWLDMAKRGMAVQQNGRIAFDYDMRIAEPFNEEGGAAPPDLWPMWNALAQRPVLLVRGAISNILSDETYRKMLDTAPGVSGVVVPEMGHAPTLEEPEVMAAIDSFLADQP